MCILRTEALWELRLNFGLGFSFLVSPFGGGLLNCFRFFIGLHCAQGRGTEEALGLKERGSNRGRHVEGCSSYRDLALLEVR